MATIRVNNQNHTLPASVDGGTPVLWILRDALGLTGTKYGCGIDECGACTVLVDGEAEHSCQLFLRDVAGSSVTTIEGLSPTGTHPLQQAWVAGAVPQCGYCQSGMILAAAALLSRNKAPSDADIDAAIDNICVCGTYQRVRAAIHAAAGQ